MKIIGIDLATSKGSTWICSLEKEPRVHLINENKNIVKFIKNFAPDIITIDAPLSFPAKNVRKEERELRSMGIAVFPPTMPGMEKLTKRALVLKQKLWGFPIFEVYPYATKKLLNLSIEKNDINDAYICGLTGLLYIEGHTRILGDSLLIPE